MSSIESEGHTKIQLMLLPRKTFILEEVLFFKIRQQMHFIYY